MRTAAALLAALLPLAAGVAHAQTSGSIAQVRSSGRVRWDWTDQPARGTLIANFVRANVRIVRSDVRRVRLHATSADRGSDGSPVTLVVSGDGTDLRIIDRYPPSPPFGMRECLPPDGEHGGAWNYDDTLEVTLVLPRGLPASVTTMSGSIAGQ